MTIVVIVIIVKYLLNCKWIVPAIFLNEKVRRTFLYSLVIFPNQLTSRHHKLQEFLGLLLFSFLPPLQQFLLVWPGSRLKSLKRKGLESKEVITAKGLNKNSLIWPLLSLEKTGKSKQERDTRQCHHL